MSMFEANVEAKALTGVAQWVSVSSCKPKVCWVQFLVRARAWVVVRVPGWGGVKATHQCFSHTSMLLYSSFSLPLSLKIK